ncbi:TonB-dependent receptor [Gracilimonas sp.]|uniref:TonB-dependent receptor n=1 Tax=Gracilimonas sp. TaxID=1974203 RepID=UPI003BAC7368
MLSRQLLLSIVFILLLPAYVCAQKDEAQISGVLTIEDDPAVGITVYLEGTNKGVATNQLGEFRIANIKPGSYTLIISGVGFKKISQNISLGPGEHRKLETKLEYESQSLKDLTVFGKSEATRIREQAYAIEVVDTEGFKNLSSNANDILKKVSGVNIRQSGGVGSEFTLSLNGLSGNQVRIFLDGIPMDYFGSSLSLNNFSANLIDRIEVYKGVVPIHLSSDALGGAINVVTGNKLSSYADASYSLGSFGTHIGSINAQFRDEQSGFTTRLKSFYNSSRNNYSVPVKLVNFETGKEAKDPTEVERFHDAYESKMAWVETGFTGVDFADQLMAGVLYSDNYDEVQQPANAIGEAKVPYGGVATKEQKFITNISYKKKGLVDERLNISSYLVAVFSEGESRDTSSYDYNWQGEKVERIDKNTGEIENRKTLLTLNTDNYLGNFNSEFALTDNHNLAFNYSLNFLTLTGSDPFKDQNNTQFSNPNDVSKQVYGLSYTSSFIDERLKNTVFSKYYDYSIESLQTDYQGEERNAFRNEKDSFGFGVSTTFQFADLQLKASFENSTRFPEVIELFGNGLNTVPNPALKPEVSSNYNLGFIYSKYTPVHSVMVSVNGFIRDARDFIIPEVQGIKVTHINNGKVLSKGVDIAGTYSYKNNWIINLSGTFQDLRDNNKWRNGVKGVPNSLYKVRIPNVPYLFGNMSVSYRGEGLFDDNDSYSVSLTENYVHSFYYRWENLASRNKGEVPTQWTTGLEMVYSFPDQRLNLSAGVSNLLDSRVYDNYQQLRPGRAFNIKLRYLIN